MHSYLLHDLLRESALNHPEKKAVVFKQSAITYMQLEKMSSRLAATLAGRGLKRGDRAGIMLNKSIEAIVVLFGILKAGGIYVPLDPNSPAERAGHIIRNCGIEVLFTDLPHFSRIRNEEGLSVKTVVVTGEKPEGMIDCGPGVEALAWSDLFRETSEPYLPVKMADANAAYILHTSGSTGTPKGVVISHLNAVTFVAMAADFFRMNERDRVANHAPLHFDLSVFDIFCAIRSGATIVIVPEFLATFPTKLAEFIDREEISVWNSVSSVLVMLADRGQLKRFEFGSLRLVHFSGDIMPVKYLAMLKARLQKAEFYNIYGQTEANSSMGHFIACVPDDTARKIPIGKSFPNFEVFALDEAGRIISGPGEEGELYINSSTVALGYWNDEGRTRERFVPDPRPPFPGSTVYKTGDLVRIDSEGNYVFAGRKDHMIKSRGYRIELDEIEIVLNSHPCVRRGAVIAVPDEIVGNRIVAYVSLAADTEPDAASLLDYCAVKLPRYMLPEIIEYCKDLPVTPSGKIDRKALTVVQ